MIRHSIWHPARLSATLRSTAAAAEFAFERCSFAASAGAAVAAPAFTASGEPETLVCASGETALFSSGFGSRSATLMSVGIAHPFFLLKVFHRAGSVQFAKRMLGYKA